MFGFSLRGHVGLDGILLSVNNVILDQLLEHRCVLEVTVVFTVGEAMHSTTGQPFAYLQWLLRFNGRVLVDGINNKDYIKFYIRCAINIYLIAVHYKHRTFDQKVFVTEYISGEVLVVELDKLDILIPQFLDLFFGFVAL